MAIGGIDPKSSLPGGPGHLSNTVLLETTYEYTSVPALAGCKSVTDNIHTYRRTDHATATAIPPNNA